MKIKRVERAGHADVYNMEVEETHDFVIQGGVISHNCADETRYMCMPRPISPRMAAKPDPYWHNPMYTALDIPKEDVLPAPEIIPIQIREVE